MTTAATPLVSSDWVGMVFALAEALGGAYVAATTELDDWVTSLAVVEHRAAQLIGDRPGVWPHHHAVLAVERLRADHQDLRWRLEWILETEAQPVAGIYALPLQATSSPATSDLIIDAAFFRGHDRWSAILALAVAALDDPTVAQRFVESIGPAGLPSLLDDAAQMLSSVEVAHDQTTAPAIWGEADGPPTFEGMELTQANVDVMVDSLGVLFGAASTTSSSTVAGLLTALADEDLGPLLIVVRSGTYSPEFLLQVARRLMDADPDTVAAALPGGRRWTTGMATIHDDLVDPRAVVLEALLRQPESAALVLRDERLASWLLTIDNTFSGAGVASYPTSISALRADVLLAAFEWADSIGGDEVNQLWNAVAEAVEANGLDLDAAVVLGHWLVANWHLVVADQTAAQPISAMGPAVVPVLVQLFAHDQVRDTVLAGVVDDGMRRFDQALADAGTSGSHLPAARVDAAIGPLAESVRIVWLALAEQSAAQHHADGTLDNLVSNVLAVLRVLAGQATNSIGLAPIPAKLLILAANQVAASLLDGSPSGLPNFDEFLSGVALAEVQLQPPSPAQLPVQLPVGIQVRFLQTLLDARPDLHRLVPSDPHWFVDGQIRLPSTADPTSPELHDFAVWFQLTTVGAHNELTDLFFVLEPSFGPS